MLLSVQRCVKIISDIQTALKVNLLTAKTLFRVDFQLKRQMPKTHQFKLMWTQVSRMCLNDLSTV